MIKALTSKTAWIAFFLAFVLSFMMAAKAHAVDQQNQQTGDQQTGEQQNGQSGVQQTGQHEQAAKKYHVTFPIAELGGCTDYSACRTFCEDPQNKEACVAFAKSKGFYKENKTATQNSLMIAAQQELGCNSPESCKTFCGQQDNWQKCGEFAKKHNLGGGQTQDPAKKEIIQKAQEMLGCTSYESCKNFCTKEENKQKCDEFAKFIGLRGGVEKKGPGGCTTSQTCRQYCQQHPEECQKSPHPIPSANKCQRPANGCGDNKAWDYNTCSCKSFEDYCKSRGCNWTGSACQCANTTIPAPTYTPYPTYTPAPSYIPAPTTSDNIGTYSSVKGVSIVRGLLQNLLEWLKK